MKKSYLSILSFLLLFLLTSCGGDKPSSAASSSKAPKKEATASSGSDAAKPASNRKGKLIYKQYCQLCHGADGKLALSGAKDLSISTIDMAERINQITNGKGLMTPYKDILSEEQIEAVAEYVGELRK